MSENPMPQRKSPRLKGYDYTSANSYFVTICTQGRNCYFGEIRDQQMHLNDWGQVANALWQIIPQHFPEAQIEIYVVMPNHVHGLIFLHENARSLPDVVGKYKAGVSRQINAHFNPAQEIIWQRSFHEHIIKTPAELQRIRHYIQMNPQLWQEDKFYR